MPAIKTVTLAQAKAAQTAKTKEQTAPNHFPDAGEKVDTTPIAPKISTEKTTTYPKNITPPLKNTVIQSTTKEKEENTTLRKPIENIESTDNIQEVEEEKILEEKDKETIQAYFSEEDIDEKEAREAKEKIEAEKQKTYNEKKREFPSSTDRKRKSYGKKPRPCQKCGTIIAPKDPRTKFCKPCGIQAAKE